MYVCYHLDNYFIQQGSIISKLTSCDTYMYYNFDLDLALNDTDLSSPTSPFFVSLRGLLMCDFDPEPVDDILVLCTSFKHQTVHVHV